MQVVSIIELNEKLHGIPEMVCVCPHVGRSFFFPTCASNKLQYCNLRLSANGFPDKIQFVYLAVHVSEYSSH